MALQLKNKAKEENTAPEKSKKGKYKRKRNVFGKRLTRFGLFGLIIGLTLAFAITKTVFTLQQNRKQAKIKQDLTNVEQQINDYKKQINKKTESYENVGELIATLPVSFDQQATSLDLDRMVRLSGLKESDSRKIDPNITTMPFECSVSTVKAVKITMVLYGKNDEIESALTLINCLTEYKHENFYYIESFSYSEDRSLHKRTTITVEMYTFYNDVEISSSTPENTDTATTTTTK